MKKDTLRLLIIALVVLIAYNFAVFMIPCYKTSTFWISWGFSLLSFAVSGYGIYTGLIKKPDAKSRFYGFPIARIGVIYLVIQVAVGGVFTTAARDTTIRRIVWHGRPLQDDLNATATIFRGSATASSNNASLHNAFTAHVGGDFDASQINPGSRFYVEYSGARNGVYLALQSHSGATQWSRVNADETQELENGRYVAWFNYDNFARAWGTNFARLDQLTVYTTTPRAVTLHRIAYFAGEVILNTLLLDNCKVDSSAV